MASLITEMFSSCTVFYLPRDIRRTVGLYINTIPKATSMFSRRNTISTDIIWNCFIPEVDTIAATKPEESYLRLRDWQVGLLEKFRRLFSTFYSSVFKLTLKSRKKYDKIPTDYRYFTCHRYDMDIIIIKSSNHKHICKAPYRQSYRGAVNESIRRR